MFRPNQTNAKTMSANRFFNQLHQYVSSPSNKVYYYIELVVLFPGGGKCSMCVLLMGDDKASYTQRLNFIHIQLNVDMVTNPRTNWAQCPVNTLTIKPEHQQHTELWPYMQAISNDYIMAS